MGKRGKATAKTANPDSSTASHNQGRNEASQPKLLPVLRPRPLSITDLVPAAALSIFSVPNFLSAAECRSIIASGDALPWQTVAHAASKLYASRDNDRIHWTDAGMSLRVWQGTGLQQLFADIEVPIGSRRTLQAVGLNTGWRLYRYRPGQHFGAHYDESADCPDFPGAQSLYTMLVYLNDDFDGGETVFYKQKNKPLLSVQPATGLCVFHTQGSLCMLHEGAEVTRGEKWLLRSDVMFA